MSIAAINWVAKQRVGNSNAKALLFWLAFHHNAETGLCCPGIKTLQAVQLRTVMRETPHALARADSPLPRDPAFSPNSRTTLVMKSCLLVVVVMLFPNVQY